MRKCNRCFNEFRIANWNKDRKFCSQDCYWKSLKGRKLSQELKEKISNALKLLPEGTLAYWKGKKNPKHSAKMKGKPSWNKGIPMREDSKRKLSKFTKGYRTSPNTEFKKGLVPWNKGKEWSEEHRKKLSLGRLRSSKMKLENHYNWQGGKSFEPYTSEFNKALKRFIRERDRYICILCKKTEEDELNDFKRVLSVDHKNGDKRDCSIENLRTLCCQCNSSEMQRLRKSTRKCEVTK